MKELNGPIRGRQWLKLQHNDERKKSGQLPSSREQAEFNCSEEMGQNNSTNALTGTKYSKKFEPKLEFAIKVGKNMLVSSYKDDENLQKVITIVKNTTEGKIRALDSPRRNKFTALSLDENDLLYIDDRLVILKLPQGPINISL